VEVPGTAGRDPTQVGAIVDLLLTAAYLDGHLHPREHACVRQYVDSVLMSIEQTTGKREAAWRAYFDDMLRTLETEIAGLAQELHPVGDGTYVAPKLRGRANARFRGLAPGDQAGALELLHALLHADGGLTHPEHELFVDLTTNVVPVAPPPALPPAPGTKPTPKPAAKPAAPRGEPVVVLPPTWLELTNLAHPLLDPLEHTYSPHPIERKAQIDWDYNLVQQVLVQWQRQRQVGTGHLSGVTDITQIPVGARFLDGYVHVTRPDHPVEYIVLGDLHGCYSCLKAALLQSNVVERAWAHQWDPQRFPDVKLVFLGDYIDRGRFSFDGVLRAALQLFVALPDQVILLRGNHEWLTWFDNRIVSGVYPAEALASIVHHVPIEMLEAYRQLFEMMPTTLMCDRTLFVHGGIPRGDTFEAKYRDLSSFNDPELRFQMMWSDPGPMDQVPIEVQRGNPRFTFGHAQFRAFMERTGFTTMVRGHEVIERGFDVFYDLGDLRLLTVFSAGGHDNADLPANSGYRAVNPMALTLRCGHGVGQATATPWPIQYQPFNYEPHNGLYRAQPLLEFRYA
jgi:hypothetical protein